MTENNTLVMKPDRELFNSLYERRDKCVKELRAIIDCIHALQENCDHEWRQIATGPTWTHEECKICKKQRAV